MDTVKLWSFAPNIVQRIFSVAKAVGAFSAIVTAP